VVSHNPIIRETMRAGASCDTSDNPSDAPALWIGVPPLRGGERQCAACARAAARAPRAATRPPRRVRPAIPAVRWTPLPREVRRGKNTTPRAHGLHGSRRAGARHSRCLSSGRSHTCCGVVRNCCCDVSAPRGTVFEVSAAPPPKPAIACTS